jgi:hypothetical protein
MAGFLLLLRASSTAAFDAEEAMPPMTKVISAQGALEYFNSGRLDSSKAQPGRPPQRDGGLHVLQRQLIEP